MKVIFVRHSEPDYSMLELAYTTYMAHGGDLPSDSPIRYETAAEMRTRFLKALEKYRQYDTVVIVCHGMLIRQFVAQEAIDYCELFEVAL